MTELVELDGSSLSIDAVVRVARAGARVRLSGEGRERVRAGRRTVERLLANGSTVYGLNTGFGHLRNVRIPPEQLRDLQVNLIRSHCTGVGPPLPEEVVRALILLRANVLASGHSGVRPVVVDALLELLEHDLLPVVPELGSVGASGDLAPLAHLASALIGEGDVRWRRRIRPAADALAEAGLSPVELEAKEGLSLINGTQLMTAIGALVVADARELVRTADLAGAMTLEALLGTDRAFDERLARLRPHPGHARSAANLRRLLAHSGILASHRNCDRVQDSYSLRCMPQVHGAVRDALEHAGETITRELNAVTDNPIVFPDAGETLSGGNFHGAPVALSLDYLAAALTVLASISERRIERLVNPDLSELPPFLAPEAGLHSGFMIAQVTAAALVSECKTLAHPAGVDSIPTSANQEDHVSMGPLAARKCRAVQTHCRHVLAIELLAAGQALEMRRPLVSSPAVEAVLARLRDDVAPLDADRRLSADIEAVVGLIDAGDLGAAAEAAIGPLY